MCFTERSYKRQCDKGTNWYESSCNDQNIEYRSMLSWFGHLARMDEETNLYGECEWGRP